MAEPCERTVRNRRRNANELLVEKSNRLRDRNETLRLRIRTENNEEREERVEMRRIAKRRRTHQIQPPNGNNQQAVCNQHGRAQHRKYVLQLRVLQARYWGHELNTLIKYTKCCSDGNVSLDPLPETPALLR
jgi:hypothetical protein